MITIDEDNYFYTGAKTWEDVQNKLHVSLMLNESQDLEIARLTKENEILHVPDWEKRANRLFQTVDDLIKLNIPYKFDANYFTDGAMDCSLFARIAFISLGVRLPRSSKEQAKVGTPVLVSDIRPLDWLGFDIDGDGVTSHCGIYAGNGIIAHTNKAPLLPRYQTLADYGQKIIIARRH